MAISLKNIRPGECFVTGGGQVRRILEVEAKAKLVDKQRNKIETEVLKIGYEVRGKKSRPKNLIWGSITRVSAKKFAADVLRKVTWDYDPDFPERKP